MNAPATESSTTSPQRFKPGAILFKILPPLVLAAGVAGAVILVKSTPRPERKPPPPMKGLVQTMKAEAKDQPIVIRAMGTVIPAREVQLKSQVGGSVVWTHPSFQEGSRFDGGEVLIKIDPADYEIAKLRAESMVARANYEYQLELGYQDVASREWKLIREGRPSTDREELLALRKPQLQNVQAGLASAQAELKQAELNLGRTELRAPFNALLLSRATEMGSVVNPQEPVATLVGTDEYWVQVSMPVDRLHALTGLQGRSDTNVTAKVYLASQSTESWEGRVISLLGDLEQNGRMARILVAIPDPFGQEGGAPLLLGSYVHVALSAGMLKQVTVLPRSALREGDRLWLASADDTLEIRDADVVWRDEDSVYISNGVRAGDRVILTDVAIPVAGMPLIIQTQDPAPGSAGLEK